jgi:Type IV secretion-system coupling protein DNA-binding domain
MSVEDWLPIKSNDPAANAAIAVVLAMVAITLVVVGGMFLLPVVLIIGIAKGAHWYTHRPTPTDQLYAQTQQRGLSANFPDPEKYLDAFINRFIDAVRDDLPAYQIYLAMVHITDALYKEENLNNPLPPLVPANTIEEGRYRDQLIAHQRKTQDAPRTLEVFNTTLGKCYLDFIAALPPIAKATPAEFAKCDEVQPFATFPLIDIVPDAAKLVMSIILPFFKEDTDQLGLFANIRKQLDRNFHEASGAEYPASSHKLITPDKHKGTPREIVLAYLNNTPFEALFYAPIPFSFSYAQRQEHMHIVGGSGHGKTQLLQHFILNDLQRDDPPALIVIDSQGDMLNKIQRLKLFTTTLADKLVVIDPEDIEHPPALNMFDSTNTRLASYSVSHKEQIEAGVIELYNYIFASIAAEMTSRQSTAFAFVTRLMLSVPGATIHTLRELMEDPARSLPQSKLAEYIQKLDATSQSYFENQFFTNRYADLRQQIARRLYGVLSVPSFDRMFSSKRNRLDMFEAIQGGKVVVVNTSKALLKTDASALFGRYMIALAIKAAFERVATQDRRPAFLFIDEAAEYFDENIETLLSQARKFNLGVVIAHQHLDQLSTGLRSSVAANTSIKLAGGVSDKDARALAPDMRTTPEFITSMQKHSRSTEFASYVRNYTANAVRLTIPFGSLEGAPKMSPEEHSQLIARNRERYAAERNQVPMRASASSGSSVASSSKTIIDNEKSKLPEIESEKPARTNPDGTSTDASSNW